MVGMIDGIAEATASIVKVFSGYVSDRFNKRKPLILLGYGLAAASKPFFPLATGLGRSSRPEAVAAKSADGLRDAMSRNRLKSVARTAEDRPGSRSQPTEIKERPRRNRRAQERLPRPARGHSEADILCGKREAGDARLPRAFAATGSGASNWRRSNGEGRARRRSWTCPRRRHPIRADS